MSNYFKSYSSKSAIRIESVDFEEGGLPFISYVRPDKLFTADTSIVENIVGKLTSNIKKNILQKVRASFC